MEIDGSINIYQQRMSGSRKSSQDSRMIKSAIKTSSGDMTSPQRRPLSGSRHPHLQALRQISPPADRQHSNERNQSSGSAVLRRKHQD